MNFPKRHHYLPKYYLKGFLNNENTFAIYDKKREVLKQNYYNSKSHFFEFERNNIEGINGNSIDALEQLYSRYDNDMSELFQLIQEKNNVNTIITASNIQKLKTFISMMYWRIPETDKLYDKFFKGKTFKDIGFSIRNKDTGESNEIISHRIFHDSSFRKLCRFLIIPLHTFDIMLKESDVGNWHYYYDLPNRTKPLHLCGDNPIIFKNIEGFFDFKDDLILRLTSDKNLIFSRKKPKMLPPEFGVDLDLMIFKQANRYVCGPNREYLSKIAEMYYYYDNNIDTNFLKSNLFNYLS